MMRTSSSQLKAKLGKYMRAVRSGKEVVVTDRDQPVARLVPYDASREPSAAPLRSSQARDPAAPPLGEVRIEAIRYRGPSTTELLREDRSRR
jgi:prevent-host-death family protein